MTTRTTLNLIADVPVPNGTHRPEVSRRVASHAVLLACVVSAGCASRGGVASGGGVFGGATPDGGASPSGGGTPGIFGGAAGAASGPPEALEAERKYLLQWFSDTPVVIAFDRDNALRVEVPLQFAFDARQAKPKPALLRVLDRVGNSLRRVPATRVHLTAPPDASAPTDAALVERRVRAVREEVVSRGVNAIRIASTQPSTNGSVQIRMVMAPPA